MERAEFDNIVRLAEKAYKATLEAKAAHKEYATAASDAYAKKAILQAKQAYEDCINAPDFKQALIARMNRDFNTSFSAGNADVFAPEPAAHTEEPAHHVEPAHFEPEPESESEPKIESQSATPDSQSEEKSAPTREFAIDYEPEESSRNVWQSRT